MLRVNGSSMLVVYGFSGPYIPTIMLTIRLGLVFLIVALCFPTMRYDMDGTRLTLLYGPLLRYTIDILKVSNIRSFLLALKLIPGTLASLGSYLAIAAAFVMFQNTAEKARITSGKASQEIVYFEG